MLSGLTSVFLMLKGGDVPRHYPVGRGQLRVLLQRYKGIPLPQGHRVHEQRERQDASRGIENVSSVIPQLKLIKILI